MEDTLQTCSGRDVALRIYVEHHNLDKADFAMASLVKFMAWDEEVFGLEYDLDLFNIVAVDIFNMGTIENKSLNIFNSRLAHPSHSEDCHRRGLRRHRGGTIPWRAWVSEEGNREACLSQVSGVGEQKRPPEASLALVNTKYISSIRGVTTRSLDGVTSTEEYVYV